MAQQISRNPFARESLFRESVSGSCSFCGCKDRRGKVGRYFIERDAIRVERNYLEGKFCSVSCMRSYHDWMES